MYQIRVKLPGMKRAKLLTPEGTMTGLTIYASLFIDRGDAKRIAAEIKEQNPGATATVVKRG